MEVDLLEYCDRIRPWVPQCPGDTIRLALLDTIRDFCNVTRCYTYEDTDTIQALVNDYELEVPVNTVEPIGIEAMSVNGRPSYPKDPTWLRDAIGADWRTREADDFRFFTSLATGTFCFPCTPTRMGLVDGIAYTVSLRPTLSAISVDDAQAAEWLEAWTYGALAKLKGTGGNPPPSWYDPVGAKDQGAMYRQARGAARIRVANAFNSAPRTAISRRVRFA